MPETTACYTLSVSVNPAYDGYTTVGNVNCTGGYTPGTQVPISAVAYYGYYFVNWTSTNCTLADASAASTTCTMNDNASVTANFAAGAPPPPILATGTATSITTTTALLNGTVNPNGNSNVNAFFEYGPTSSYPYSTGSQSFSGSSTSPFSFGIGGLACGTTYHFAAAANSTAGTTLGLDVQFTTGACGSCTVNVTAPAGGERLSLGKTFTITWSSVFSECGAYKTISLYRGTTFIQTIANNITDSGSYVWTLSNSYTPASDYVVKVDFGNGASTSAPFTIGPPSTLHDYSADSRSDIVLQNTDGTIAEWQMNSFSYGGMIVDQPPAGWKVAGSGDFNGDGKADLVLQNASTGDVAIWLMNGYTLTGGAIVATPGLSWKIVAVGDTDADGIAEIFLQNQSNGDVAEWKVNGLSVTGGWIIASPGAAWKIVATGDFDGDGRADLLLENSSTNQIAAWLMTGTTVRAGALVGVEAPPSSWRVVGTGDFAGTGKSGILLQNTSGTVAEWVMDGVKLVAGYVICVPDSPAWVVKATGDFNGDGRSDVLLQNTTNGYLAQWQLNGTQLTDARVFATPGTAWSPTGN